MNNFVYRGSATREKNPQAKNPASGKTVSYAQIDLKLLSRRKILILTTKSALVNPMIVVCINGRFDMLVCR